MTYHVSLYLFNQVIFMYIIRIVVSFINFLIVIVYHTYDTWSTNILPKKKKKKKVLWQTQTIIFQNSNNSLSLSMLGPLVTFKVILCFELGSIP
jgi:hypothetical protein